MSERNPFCRIDTLNGYYDFRATVDVLRLDLLHSVISGNKWFKLKYHLQEATKDHKALLTFGGAFSNHIVATAAAAKSAGLQSIGIIRGEKPPVLSHTLVQAQAYGMLLFFTSRDSYSQKKIPSNVFQQYNAGSLYTIPEGGYGINGASGARDILLTNKTADYTHIITAVGTGTTLAGLTMAAGENQRVIGISVMKNNFSLSSEIRHLLTPDKWDGYKLLHDYHFGGYARKAPELLNFMNDFFTRTAIPTDFVYTGRSFYAALDLLRNGYFSSADKLLLIHTGGLQGNLSLKKGTLIFG